MKETVKTQSTLFVKGALIGGCMIVPGMSAGTVMILCGIYGTLLGHINGFYKDKKHFFDAVFFLIPIALGGMVGIFTLSRALKFLIEKFALPVFALFAGLVLGSVPMVLSITYPKRDSSQPRVIRVKNKSKFKWWHLVPAVIACGLVILFAMFQAPETVAKELRTTTGIMLVVAGAITVAAMIIPGISGAFLLILIGYYNTVLDAASTIDIPILLLFALGAPVGLFVAAFGINFFLKRFRIVSHMVIVGFLLGSVIGIFMYPGTYDSATGAFGIVAATILFILGFALVVMLSWLQKDKKDLMI